MGVGEQRKKRRVGKQGRELPLVGRVSGSLFIRGERAVLLRSYL